MAFMTKKQRALMRQRKRQLKAVTVGTQPSDENPQGGEDEVDSSPIAKKRKLIDAQQNNTKSSEESKENSKKVADSPKVQSETDKSTENKNVLITVPIPEKFVFVAKIQEKKRLNNKPNPAGSSDQKANADWKKYKKDQRRKFRKKFPGIPDENITFVNDPTLKGTPYIKIKAEQEVKPKDRPGGKKYPSIKEMLELEKKVKQQLAEQKKREEIWNSVSDEEKAKYVALDCEMVGVGTDGKQSALARVTLVNWNHDVILDTHVKVPVPVKDYRTWVSGIKPKDIAHSNDNAMELHKCRKLVGELIKDKIVVGHSLKNDFAALILDHPRSHVRDTAMYTPYMRREIYKKGEKAGQTKLKSRKLKELALEKLGIIIQKEGEAHSPIDDAIAAMDLYKLERDAWEKSLEHKDSKNKQKRKR